MLTAIVSLLVLIIVLLAIPITLSFQATWKQIFVHHAKISWMFGIIHITIPQSKSSKKETTPKQKKKSIRKRSKKKPIPSFIWEPTFRQLIIKFIKRLWHSIHKSDLVLYLHIGLNDPADTGQLWAILGPISGILSNTEQASITIEPDFSESALDIQSHGTVRIIPLQIICILITQLLIPLLWLKTRSVIHPSLASPHP